ncbi:MAG: hypothetical protein IPI18_06120 [Saprospiraceae bacterium]|nr:hypothetical protein [Saprospiraceae bacterium]
MSQTTSIYVFADWFKDNPILLGVLSAQQAYGRKAFSFEYSKDFLSSERPIYLNPDIKYFHLKTEKMIKIENEVKKAVLARSVLAKKMGMARSEIELMSKAFAIHSR